MPRDAPAGEDATEISSATAMIVKQAPVHHARQQRKLFTLKLQSVAKVSGAVAQAIYSETTGDETLAKSPEEKKRVAAVAQLFATGIGDTKFIGDLRALANTANKLGKTCFDPFWEVMHEHLGSTDQAAHNRRHNPGVSYSAEVISHPALYQQVCDKSTAKREAGDIDADARIPILRYMEYQFMPANEYLMSVLPYPGRFAICQTTQSRGLNLNYPHVYCSLAGKLLAENYARKFIGWGQVRAS